MPIERVLPSCHPIFGGAGVLSPSLPGERVAAVSHRERVAASRRGLITL